MGHRSPLPIRAARFALGHVGIAVPGSDFLIQLRFTCQTFPGTNDNLSRAQKCHRLAPHLLTVGKHHCQRTERWERRGKKKKKKTNKSRVGHLGLLEKKCQSNKKKKKSRCAAFAW